MGIADLFSSVKKSVKKKSKKSKKDPELKSKKKKSAESADESAEPAKKAEKKAEPDAAPKAEVKVEGKVEKKSKLASKRVNRSVGDIAKKFEVKKTNGLFLISKAVITAASDIRQIIPTISRNPQTKPVIDALESLHRSLDAYTIDYAPNYGDPFAPVIGEAAKKYLEVFEKNMFKTLIPMIRQKLDEDVDSIFYSELLKTLDEYLSRAGFYTINITPGDDSKPVLQYMDTDSKPTKEKHMKGAVASVEQLPYILEYKNEAGENLPLCFKGKMTVYTK